MEESDWANDILDMLLARTDSRDLRKEDDVINRSMEDTKAKEDTEEEPLSYVTEDVAWWVLSWT